MRGRASDIFPFLLTLAAGTVLGWQISQRRVEARLESLFTSAQAHASDTAATGASALPFTSDWRKFSGTGKELLVKLDTFTDPEERRYFLFRTLHEMEPSRLPGLAGELAGFPRSDQSAHQALALVIKLWTKRDASAALAWAHGLTGDVRISALDLVLVTISSTHLEEALQQAASLDEEARWTVILSIARQLATKDPQSALALLQKQSHQFSYESWEILEAWARKDGPAAAAAAARTGEMLGTDTYSTGSVYAAWASQDPAAAAAGASALGNSDTRALALSRVLQTWANSDARGAAAYFQTLPLVQRSGLEIGDFVGEVAKLDPAAAIGMLDGLNGTARNSACNDLARAWSEHDLEGAVGWINGLTSSDEQRTALGALRVGKLNDEGLIAMASRFTNRRNRLEFLTAALSDSSRKHPESLLSQLLPEDATEVLSSGSLLDRLATQDPVSTAALLERVGSKDAYAWAVIADVYAEKDFTAAYNWALGLPPEAQSEAIVRVIEKLGRTDPVGALQKAHRLVDASVRKDAIQRTVEHWLMMDAAGLENALPSLKDETRATALNCLLKSKIELNPAAAAEVLLTLQQSNSQTETQIARSQLYALASHWAKLAPEAAASWGQRLEGDCKDVFFQEVASRWMLDDPLQASAWIKNLPPGASKDGAVESLIAEIKMSDPQSAIIWTGQIQDETKRDTIFRSVLGSLYSADPIAGRAAINRAPLSAEVKQELLEQEK